ncbi:MAG TPA: hypothetical protein VGM75_21475 [Pseudonocardiaceae bacterium]|jgi:hypothetical protein
MTSRRRAEMFIGEPADPRIGAKTVGDERAMLLAALKNHRSTLSEPRCASGAPVCMS